MINPFVICSVEQMQIYRDYNDRQVWELQCCTLGAPIEVARAYDASAQAYAATTLYPNRDVVAYARMLALEALKRGDALPADAESAIRAEHQRQLARLLAGPV